MTSPLPDPDPELEPAHRILVVGADGAPMDVQPEDQEGRVAEMVEQPAKVMRIGTMVKQLLEEVRAAP
ncbi:MAG: hypothetical protein QOD91_1465, partial [Frankiales bacterium]|nr:hypothetical protein [Frankiales bacterium]